MEQKGREGNVETGQKGWNSRNRGTETESLRKSSRDRTDEAE